MKEDKMDEPCGTHGEMRNAYKTLFGKAGRPRHRWEDNVKTDLKLDRRVWAGFMWFRLRTVCKLM
jgi:hypothetical protein